MLHTLYLATPWELPEWFDDLEMVPTKSELDVWRWAFRMHGSRTLTKAQKDIVWTVFTYAQAKEGVDKYGRAFVVGQAWPKQETVAKQTNTTVTTVGKAMEAAEEAGWLVRQRVPNKVSRIFFSVPLELAEAVDRRSRRSVPTENRSPVVTENHPFPDGEPDPRPDGDEPTVEPTSPTLKSTSPGQLVDPSPTRVRDDGVTIEYTFGAEKGHQRTVPSEAAAKLIAIGHAIEVAA